MKIVITGSICSGKSTLVSELEKRGYHVIHEYARELIQKEEKKEKPLFPWTEPLKFQQKLSQILVQKESQLDNNTTYFIDGCVLDSLTFLRVEGIHDLDAYYKDKIKDTTYDYVFLLEPVQFQNDPQRPQSESFQQKLFQVKKEVFTEFGYELILVPDFQSVTKRIEFILSKIKEL
ncbi:MAG: AAA family ATPase [Candidatus Woesearchaeota archaeon]